MPIRIGIPRSLLYYKFFPLWRDFFQGLGAEVVTSGPTTKAILQEGLRFSVDEACLPVKVAFGHVSILKDSADYIFVPRLVSMSPREYECPKFLGFPDMVRQCVPNLPGIIDHSINMYRRQKDLYGQFAAIGSLVCKNPVKIYSAYRKAMSNFRQYTGLVESGLLPEQAFSPVKDKKRAPAGAGPSCSIAVIGHPYNIYDSYINIGLLKRIEESGISVVTADNVPEETVNKYAGTLRKRLFWTLGRRMVGAACYYLESPNICGMVHVASFACGPDSLTGEMIERRARRAGNIPFLNLVLDEHTGEAGLVTRVEAFLDMVGMHRAAAGT
ncbi:MAG: acyl-CoA dehydratase activase-related protein [Bacillota bacterium]